MKSVELKLQWHVQIVLLLFGHFLVVLLNHAHFFCLLVLFLFLLLFRLPIRFYFLVHALAPVLVHLLRNPCLDLNSGYSLHAEYFHAWVVATDVSIGHSLNCFGMLALAVLHHGVDGWEFLGTLRTAKMLSFLVVMQDDFVLEWLVTVEAEGAQTAEVSFSSAHWLLKLL